MAGELVPVKELRAVRAYLIKITRALSLNDWVVNVMDRYSDLDCKACIYTEPKVQEANMYLGVAWDSIESDDECGITLVHEMLHLTNAEVNHYFNDAVVPSLPRHARSMAETSFDALDETFIHKLAKALYPLLPPYGKG